jgi:hypothetical protein
MSRRDWLLRWIGPAVLLVVLLTGYQILVAPILRDLLDDWAFLHAARAQAIQQMQQRKPSP